MRSSNDTHTCGANRPGGLVLPSIEESTGTRGRGSWIVTVFNNEVNTYEEVMVILMIATACSADEAYIEAWEIDHYGKCIVHTGSEEECQGTAEVIATIGIRVEATPDN